MKLPQEEPHGLPKVLTPKHTFHYTYAVFHSPVYRMRYGQFLKTDFPRLPLTGNLGLFHSLSAKGAEVIALHLLESPKLLDFITVFPEKGDNLADKVHYTNEDARVWINENQYFGEVPGVVWDLHIGGYKVCEKWLKDRRGRPLSYDDAQHYRKVIVALKETIRLMAEINKIIDTRGG